MSNLLRVRRPAALRGAGPAIALVAVVAIVAIAYLLLASLPVAQDWLYTAVGATAAVAVLAGVRIHRPAHRGPWLLLAAGTALFATGDLAWMILDMLGEEPFPSVADVAYLLGYPVLVLAFLHIIAVRVADGDRSGLLDAATLATAVALVGWFTLLRPVLDAPADPLSLAIGVAYPMGDLVIIAVAIALVATPGARGASFVLLVGALGIQLVGDLLYAVQVADGAFVDGGVLDLTWLAAYAMTGAAALLPSMRLVATPHPVPIAWLSPLRLAFLTLAMLTGPALLLVHQDSDMPLLVAGTATLSLLVLVRLALVVRTLMRDNAARRSLEDELSYRATHDYLTGLANRRRLVERLEAELLVPHDPDRPISVLFLDLDDFKGINDTLGHATGDLLLVSVAGRIRGHLRQGDVAARMGGDEFGIVLRSEPEVAERVARRILDSLAQPIAIGDHTVMTRGSIGVAAARPGTTLEELLGDADIAMYRAKALGKDTVAVYAPEFRRDVMDRMELETDLRAAIENGGLSLDYQPIVDLPSSRPVGVEALVRWQHPTRGALPSSAFVPLAEATGLGAPLGLWVLETACAQVAAWRKTLDPGLFLAVNLAPRQLAGTDLVAAVCGAATDADLPLSALIVDVTEGALLLEAPELSANLAALRALGMRVAIDDFGTGYLSLANLGDLPVDILKIDRAFVAQVDRDDNPGIAEIVLNLGRALGLQVIAEGIERQEQLDAVMRLGCRLGQGYHVAPPAPAALFEAMYAPARGPEPASDSMAARASRAFATGS